MHVYYDYPNRCFRFYESEQLNDSNYVGFYVKPELAIIQRFGRKHFRYAMCPHSIEGVQAFINQDICSLN